ncbi:PHA/PHB synthase family protein [Tomitella biformata]|uniref:PHA/PHB synthase family protein n=1 Tax=Tomitella biformata TaxID=630403 RepID=UPI0004B9BB17|nr:hypothetical protein [Tomitella biformata]
MSSYSTDDDPAKITNWSARDAAAGALSAVGGGNVLARMSAVQLIGSAIGVTARRPQNLGLAAEFLRELGGIATGVSGIEADPKDARFQDPTWQGNPAYHRIMQAYLAWSELMNEMVDAPDVPWRERARARFGMELVTSALSPANFFPGNPSAIKRAFETGGASVLRGTQNFVHDALTNHGAPTQVDPEKYVVGRDLAATPGTIVDHTALYELLQYSPTTEQVREIPIVVLPPVVNRHYFVDMAPDMSFVEYLVSAGFTVFLPVWHNPVRGEGGYTLDDYVTAVLDVLATAADICVTSQVNVFASCTAGNILLPAAAVSADRNDDLIKTIGLGVTMVGYDEPSSVGMLAGEKTVADLRRDATHGSIVEARDIERGFGFLKPDQLVWSFARSRWLMGEEPVGNEVLAWSSSPTAIASGLAADLIEISLHDSFRHPDRLHSLGSPVDLGALKQDNYVVGGRGDHISPWRSCHAATELLAGNSRFILGAGGHLPTQVSPLNSAKAKYFTSTTDGDADTWLASATEVRGSWWTDYSDWLGQRSGELISAPTEPGSATHPSLGPAPGEYAKEG